MCNQATLFQNRFRFWKALSNLYHEIRRFCHLIHSFFNREVAKAYGESILEYILYRNSEFSCVPVIYPGNRIAQCARRS